MLHTLPVLLFAAVLALPALSALSAGETGLPTPGTLDGLGVNIHFTHAKAGELEQLAAGGFRWVRMDFAWGDIERERGVYDFGAFDHLLADLDRLKLRAYFILDYGNRLYDGGLSPHTDDGRAAFCTFVAAAMKHFQGRGVVWEMWNEPNIDFWKPKPNVDDYAKLALAVGKTIREVAPKELFVGPATSEIDLHFLEACFKAGCLEYWDAVSVHPYRHRTPETAAEDYRAMRRLIARYAPKTLLYGINDKAGRPTKGPPKEIPILSGEWGYSSSVAGWGEGYDEVRQGRYLPRQWLTNLSNDIPISIWYDWHDDGDDPKEAEHNFGTVRHAYRQGQTEVYEPKPAYLAAKTLTTQLAGYRFSKRLALADDEYVLLFERDPRQALVVWTTAETPRVVTIPASKGRFRATGHLGAELPIVMADADGLKLTLTNEPVYLTTLDANESLYLAVAWKRLPLEIPVQAPGTTMQGNWLPNPLDRPLKVEVDGKPTSGGDLSWPISVIERQPEPIPIRRSLVIDGKPVWSQSTVAVVTNPLGLEAQVLRGVDGRTEVLVNIDNRDSPDFFADLVFTAMDGFSVPDPTHLRIRCETKAGKTAIIPVINTASTWRFGMEVRRIGDGSALRRLPARTFHSAIDLAAAIWRVEPDGDSKVASTQALKTERVMIAPSDLALAALTLDYRFEKGWKFLRVAPAKPIDLGAATVIGMWVKSDGSGNLIRLRVNDSTGQTFQPDAGKLTWKGWKWCEFQIAAPTAGHWGGANDGKAHAPLKLDTLFLLDQANPALPSAGSVQITGAMVIE